MFSPQYRSVILAPLLNRTHVAIRNTLTRDPRTELTLRGRHETSSPNPNFFLRQSCSRAQLL
jgi:hypothetical protein